MKLMTGEELKQQRESVMTSGSVKPDVENALEEFARSTVVSLRMTR